MSFPQAPACAPPKLVTHLKGQAGAEGVRGSAASASWPDLGLTLDLLHPPREAAATANMSTSTNGGAVALPKKSHGAAQALIDQDPWCELPIRLTPKLARVSTELWYPIHPGSSRLCQPSMSGACAAPCSVMAVLQLLMLAVIPDTPCTRGGARTSRPAKG